MIRTAAIPVLLIRVEVAEGATDGARCRALCAGLFRHILFPTDFSDTAERAQACLEYLVREARSEVTLLHVQDQVKIERHLRHKLDEFNTIDTRRLEGIKARLEQGNATRVHLDIPYGHPSTVILDRAGANDFTLIVMGSNGRGAVKELFLFVRPPRPLWPFNSPASAFWPPLAFASMAAMLREQLRNLRVEILDAPALEMGGRTLATELRRRAPAYVGIGEEAVSCVEGLRLARLAKAHGAKVIAGGCFFGHVAPQALATGLVDVVCIVISRLT